MIMALIAGAATATKAVITWTTIGKIFIAAGTTATALHNVRKEDQN